jgi:hypothetical protein
MRTRFHQGLIMKSVAFVFILTAVSAVPGCYSGPHSTKPRADMETAQAPADPSSQAHFYPKHGQTGDH